jgi:hypothetical protein
VAARGRTTVGQIEGRFALGAAAEILEDLDVLVAHDWVLGWWGSERVVREILNVVPHAHVVAAIVDREVAGEHLRDFPIHELWLGRVPGARRWYQWLLPMEAAAFA